MNGQAEKKNEIDFFGLLIFFLKRWKTIAKGTLAFTVLGIVYALVSRPVYQSEAVITPRDNPGGGGNTSLLSQFGGFGNAVAEQYGLLNANLDKMEFLLKGPEMAESVIVDNNLLPRLYPKIWDANAQAWKKGRPPNLRRAVEELRGSILVTTIPSKKFLTLAANASDSVLATDIVSDYLDALNSKIQNDTKRDAEANRDYLEKELWNTEDPAMRERIQSLIAEEIEKSMLISARAFDVLEKPAIPLFRLKPKRTQIVGVFFLIGVLLSCSGLLTVQSLRNSGKLPAKS